MIGALFAASLSIAAPADGASVPPGDISITLSARGAPAGAHAHVLLDRGPALEAGLGSPLVLKAVAAGPHFVRAVLCGKDHVSVKQGTAFALSRFWVGPRAKDEEFALSAEQRYWPDPSKPMLTLVLPTGADPEAPLLDVFVKGADLSRRGYKVRVVLDRRELPLLTEEKPVRLRAKAGKHRLTVDLLDKRGTKVQPQDRTDRMFIAR